MPTATGTVKLVGTATTKSLVVKASGIGTDKEFASVPGWVWDLVVGNAVEFVEVDWTTNPSPPPAETISAVRVG